ncbi:MAG: peptidoglycan DD-metalloendopeptidase family protein [Clostridia bacterium]
MKKILIISSLIIFTLIIFTSSTSVVGISEYEKSQKELESIQHQQKEATTKLSGVEKQISQNMYDIASLDVDILKYDNSLKNLQGKVNQVNEKVKYLEDSLQNSSQSFNIAEEMYITRLKVIYENGMPSFIDVLFTSESISDFFSKMNVINSILDYDKSLVNNMKSQKDHIDYIRKDIEIQKIQLDQLKYDTEKSAKALDDAKDAKSSKIKKLEKDRLSIKEVAVALGKQEKQAADKVFAELVKMNNTGTFGGVFAWPAPGCTTITTKFGEMYNPFGGAFSMHYGVDISGGINGKPIVAIESGIVAVAVNNKGASSSGYGNYVSIDHGKSLNDDATYKSLYGHASSVIVTAGQHVTKGQTIMYAGTSGWSTGPHLHLEVIRNNVRVDPLKYIK